MKPGWEAKGLTGNDRYQGFCVDLIQELAKLLEFQYQFVVVSNRTYGHLDPATGKWNGVIGAVVDGQVDMGLADLTITYQREQYLDFTAPFMHIGIAALFKKSQTASGILSALAILSPFGSITFWLLLVAMVVLTVLRILLTKTQDKENSSFKFVDVTSLKRSSEGFVPAAIRVVWWITLFFLSAHYIAHLTATLTSEKFNKGSSHELYSIEQLAAQKEIQYGPIRGGATQGFFQNSTTPTYAKMWQQMQTFNPSVFMKSVDEGVARVKKGNFAFFTESSSIEYILERECDLYQVGGLLDSKGYGIALKEGSPYRQPLSLAILALRENGVIATIKSRWWTGSCNNK